MPPTMDPLVARTLGGALWDAHPTRTDVRARHLAAALGYPDGWRVVRTVEAQPPTAATSATSTTPSLAAVVEKEEPIPATPAALVIVDRIHAGDPTTDCDCWFHHAAAQQAAATWIDDDDDYPPDDGTANDPFGHSGGHLLPRVAKYYKGDAVQALFQDEWWDAKIVRSKQHASGEFRYQVHYAADRSKQSGVPEECLRPRQAAGRPSSKDPHAEAVKLGFGPDWQAVATGNKRYRLTDPSGTVYTSKAKALEAYTASSSSVQTTAGVRDEGDPPWRMTGHDLLGRRVQRKHVHAVTARRNVTVMQWGRVQGWIAATDVDRQGNPGYRVEATGEPAPLFHVEYEDDPNHPYPSHTLQSQDLDASELQEILVPEDDNSGAVLVVTAPAAFR
jgi:hypothetical protein